MSDSISYQYKNLHTALYEFLATYITPAIDPTQILAGDQQNMVLPENEDYVIYTVSGQIRHGTTSGTEIVISKAIREKETTVDRILDRMEDIAIVHRNIRC